MHDGTFVWNYGGPQFSSTAEAQFLINAPGNVGINKNDPSTALDVNGTVTATAFIGDGSGLTNININVTGDNLGDHIATDTIRLFDNWLTNGNSMFGMSMSNSGTVQLNSAPNTPALHVFSADNQGILLENQADDNLFTIGLDGESFFVKDSLFGSVPLLIAQNSDNHLLELGGSVVSVYGYLNVSQGIKGDRLGLGTVTSAYRLDARDSVRLLQGTKDIVFTSGHFGPSSLESTEMYFNRNNVGFNQSEFVLYNSNWNVEDNRFFQLQYTSDTTGLTIRKGGNIGIGTTAPTAKLEVNGDVMADSFSGDGSGLTNVPGDNLGNHLATENLHMNGYFISHDGDDEGLFVDIDGNVFATNGLSSGGTVTAVAFNGDGSALTNVPGDNLGSHLATQNMVIDSFWISGDGDSEGIHISNNGEVLIAADTDDSVLELKNPGAPVLMFTETSSGYSWLFQGGNSFFRIGNSGLGTFPFKVNSDATSDRITISGDNVGIGTISPTHLLQIGMNGDATDAVANAWNTFSDRRWKTNLRNVEDPLRKIAAITGYYYNWIDRSDTTTQFGVIAQDVETVLPEIVTTDASGYKSVDYSKLTALLIEGMKAQQAMIDDLTAQVKGYETLNDTVKELQAQMASIAHDK